MHDNPEEEKLNELKILDQFGIVVGDLTKREEVTKALVRSNPPQSHMLNIEFRSLPKLYIVPHLMGTTG